MDIYLKNNHSQLKTRQSLSKSMDKINLFAENEVQRTRNAS